MSPRPFLSVIVPAFRGELVLPSSLGALAASDLPRSEWELIVVDDASGDRTSTVAAEYADTVLRLEGSPRGPAFARNRGAEAARGEILAFIDADVCVHPSVLRLMAAAFRDRADLGAVFGSYDDEPRAPGLVSRFRNLLHHHVHHRGAGETETFWAGCGAVRRNAFVDVGMMDANRFPRPQIEDIELGRRLRRAGYPIELRPEIQCTHLKRWTLRSMIVTDFRDRGVPWMRLLLSEGEAGSLATLNLRPGEKLCTALVGFAALCLPLALGLRSLLPLALAAVAVLTVVALNHRFYRLLVRVGGPAFAIAAVPLHMIFYFTAGFGAVAGSMQHYRDRRARPVTLAPATAPAAMPPAAAWRGAGGPDVPRAGRVP